MSRQLELLKKRPSRSSKRTKRRGRPRSRKGVAHGRRETFRKRMPVHVTLRLVPRMWGLRRRKIMQKIAQAFSVAADRFQTQLCHFSVQHNHIHLIVEAASSDALSRAMQGLSTRLAIALNKLRGESGRVFADRYHAHVLKTPTEVRRAVAYVLDNHLKHAREHGLQLTGPDFFSSAAWPVVMAPTTWLLASAGRVNPAARRAPPDDHTRAGRSACCCMIEITSLNAINRLSRTRDQRCAPATGHVHDQLPGHAA